jgi:hypothetical protein
LLIPRYSLRTDELVRSRISIKFVIPAKAESVFQDVLDWPLGDDQRLLQDQQELDADKTAFLLALTADFFDNPVGPGAEEQVFGRDPLLAVNPAQEF